MDAWRSLSNQLAIVSLLVPLDTNCNRLLKRPIAEHTNACAYALAGLAVWRADPGQMQAFDDWIFASNRPPTPAAVRTEAMRLVGSNSFMKALGDPWIKQHLDLNIRIYETNYVRYRKSVLPELMIGTNIISGVVRGPADLYRVLTNQFKLELPAAQSAGSASSP